MNNEENQIENAIKRSAALLFESEALIITAGAGMGVDSGLPDFRGSEGFWKAYPVIAKLGLKFEEMAQPHWFDESPALAWAFYGHRLNLYRATSPHPGFSRLLNIGRKKPLGYFVFTSNVDGHFQKAGFDPDRITECHGSIHHFQCTQGCSTDIWDASKEILNVNEHTFQALPPLPSCPQCGGLARPNVLMFGDWTWNPSRTQLQEERMHGWLSNVKATRAKVAVIEVGAGTAVPTVRKWSEKISKELNAGLIRINLREPEVPAGSIGLALKASEGILRILESY